ncbi:MAG TPA: CvpA family protein [Candidatus Aphodousia faecipullorum]|nr:CvpA family protein [Candidatus Aphodousia faecipullorum]
MNELDWAIVIVLALSTIVGVARGVIREILSIVGWVIGIVFALKYSTELADKIPLESLGPAVRTIIAAVLICVVCVFAIGLLGTILRKMLEAANISAEDRILGSVFGLLRGVVFVCAVVFLAGMTSAPTTSMWKHSFCIPLAENGIDMMMPFLPDSLAQLRR